jgi:CheY-like chemotaxis protein
MINYAYIIDDDEISIFVTSMLLEADNFARSIACFNNASDALSRLSAEEEATLPEIIFLDLNMPGLSGWDFLDVLSENEKRYLGKCDVYILTSSVNKEEREMADNYKLVSGFLHKPLDEVELLKIKRCK